MSLKLTAGEHSSKSKERSSSSDSLAPTIQDQRPRGHLSRWSKEANKGKRWVEVRSNDLQPGLQEEASDGGESLEKS